MRIGLVYEVVMSVSVACGAYLVAFQGLDASELTVDRIGVNARRAMDDVLHGSRPGAAA